MNGPRLELSGRYDPAGMDIAAVSAQLRAAAEAKPLKLPVNRRIDERHHFVSEDGLSIWFTIQLSPSHRINEAVFERSAGRPTDEECRAWLGALMPDRGPQEAPSIPDASVRRFELFEPLATPAGGASKA